MPPKEQELIHLLSPVFVLHVALLLRLSLLDRHLPSSVSSLKFSPICRQLIEQFQTRLAATVLLPSSAFSLLKIADLFDGRLLAFTLEEIGKSSTSKIIFDSTTMEIVNRSLAVLQIPSNEHLLKDVVQKLIRSKQITFVSSSAKQVEPIKEQQLVRISSPFIDAVVNPILSPAIESTLKFIDPKDQQSSRYEGKYHWHVYKPVSIIFCLWPALSFVLGRWWNQ